MFASRYPFTRSCLLLLVLFTGALAAQSPELVYPNFPEYSDFRDLYIAPEGRGFTLSSCNKILKTTNNGATWADQAFPLNATSASAINCEPGTNCQTVYLTANRGLMRSTDGGETWVNVHNRGSVTYDFSVDGIILGYSFGRPEVYLSSDDGLTWSDLSTPTSVSDEIHLFSANEWYYFGESTLYQTTDSGTNWTETSSLPEDLNVTVSERDGDTFYVETRSNKFFVSTDKGATWEKKTDNAHQYSNPKDLFKDAEDSLHVISFNGIRFSSADDGANWEQTRGPRFQQYSRYRRAEGRMLAAGTGLTLVAASEDWGTPDYLIGTSGNQLDFASIHFTDQQTGYAFAEDGELFKTQDGGQNWALHNDLGRTTGPKFKADATGALYAFAGDFTLVKSTNGGQSFTEPSYMDEINPQGRRVVFSFLSDGGLIVVTPTATARINAAGDVMDTYTSDIPVNGGTWYMQMVTDDFGFVLRDPLNPMYRTEDGGQTWTEIPALRGGTSFYTSVYFKDTDNGYLCSSNQIYATTDGGRTWEAAPSGTPPGTQIFSANGDLYIAGLSALYRSRDDGESWDNLSDFGCRAFPNNSTLQPGTQDIFVVYDNGIARYDLNGILSPVAEIAGTTARLSVVPNPNAGVFQLKLPLSVEQQADISIFDAAGRRVLQQRGMSTNQSIELREQPAGLYLVRVRTRDGQVLTARVVKR